MRRMGQLEAYIPYVRYLLSVYPGDPAVAGMDAPARRKGVLDAMRAIALRGASIQPIVFVFEDLHWIDASTEEYLNALMGSVAGAPIMIVLTYRVGYSPPFGSRSFYTTLTLHTLSGAEALDMAGLVLGTDQFPAELKAALLDKAEGVPLFVEEVAKTLLDLGVLRRENGGLRMVKGTGEGSVPDTIHGSIMARLDRLGEDGKRTVQLASVIGRQFLQRLLERIAGLTGRLEGLLGELKALEIIYEHGLLPEPAYIFKHAVIQDVAYNSLLVQRRKELHRAVGHAIEELYPDRLADHYEELAHHFWQGEEWDKALEYLERSGDLAKHAYANQGALDYYARALDAAAHVRPPVPVKRIITIHEQRSQVYLGITRYPEAIAEAERMVELARASGERRQEGAALAHLAFAHFLPLSADHIEEAERFASEAASIARQIGDQEVLAKSLYLLGALEQTHGRLSEAELMISESLQIAEPNGFAVIAYQARFMLAMQREWQGHFTATLPVFRRVEEDARAAGDGIYELFAISAGAKTYIARGEHAEALTIMAEGLAKARDRDNKFIVARIANTIGWLHQELGDFTVAVEHDREGSEIGKAIKNGNVEISSLINVGFDYLHLGDPTRALALLEDTQRRAETGFGAHRWRWGMHVAVYLAETLIALGRPGDALPQIERALAGARATDSAKYIAKGHALRGEIAMAAGQWAEAEADLTEGLEIARRIGYPTLIWQCAHALSRALAARGERDRTARDGVERAHEMARLAADTIQSVADRLPDPALSTAFLSWSRVRAVHDDLDRLRRAQIPSL